MKTLYKLLAIVMILGLAFTALPMGQAQAQTPTTTLNVADWSETATVGLTGRPSVLLDGTTYHLWYGPTDTTLYHSVSDDPAAFSGGTAVTFSGGTPLEVASTAIFKEGTTFYMVAYGANNKTFALYSSTDGTAWTYVGVVFDATGMDDLGKIDAPFVFNDGGTFKLYFQKKSVDGQSYKIYLATSATVGGPYTLHTTNPVLSPSANIADWDGKFVMHPWVVKDGDTYYMWYSAHNSVLPQRIGLATSTDGINWTKSPANPVIGPVGEPSVIKIGDTWHMWYLGSGSAVQHVSATGPFEFQTIQAAINAASAGDTINVAAGTYDEKLTVGKSITIQGAGASLTSIAPSAQGDYSLISVKNPGGDVKIDGFNFVMPVFTNYGSAIVVTDVTGAIDANTVTISNNVVTGSGNGSIGTDFGFYGQGNNAKLIIDNNILNYTGSNSIMMEQQLGTTEVTNNTVRISNDVYYDPIFSMVYGNKDVTTPQIVSGNTIYLDHSGEGYSTAITFMAAPSFAPDPKDAHYRDIQILNNTIYTGGAEARGMGVSDKSSSTTASLITGVVISGNTIIGESKTDLNTRGILLEGNIQGAVISDNEVHDVLNGVVIAPGVNNGVYPTGTTIQNNRIVNNGTGLVWNNSLATLNASPNWWGSNAGPGADQIVGDVDFTPWCGDAACESTVPNAEGVIELSGNIDLAGGMVINEPHLTIHLAADTVIQNSSPCFTINADNTSIIAEPGAKCIPTDSANGINVEADVTGVTVDGLEITKGTSTTGDGIAFAGAVTDVVLVDNYIHGLDGDGISFAAQPAGVVDIQGNLFQNNTGLGINASTFTVPAEYNSWGSAGGAAAGDGISTNVDADPWTHVDLYMTSSGAPWANQVVKDSTITYAVKAHMVNVNAADFVLKYDQTLLSVASVAPGSDFVGIYTNDNPETQQPLVNTSVAGEIRFTGFKLNGTVSGDVTLYTVTFDTLKTGTGDLDFDEATDGFGMPGVGSSSNVYASTLNDGSVNVIDLPSMTSSDIGGPYIAGIAKDFHVTVGNPVGGGIFVDSIYYVFTIHDAEKSDLTSLTCKFDGSTDTDILALMDDSTADLVGRVGYNSAGFPMAPNFSTTTTCTANFNKPGTYAFDVSMVDSASAPADFELASLSESAVVDGDFAVTGTFSMQGRSFRGGIPVLFTWGGTPAYAPNFSTINQISNNLVAILKNGGTYTITTNQPRYLNVTTDLAKTVAISDAKTMSALELKGGNAIWTDNKINIQDAACVGSQFGTTGDGDVNFDGKINVQDLALVGGNYNLTSEGVYGTWVP